MGNWENGGSNICELHQKRSSCIETKGSASPNLTEHEDSRELGMKRSGALSWVTDQVWDSIPKEERKKAWVNTASMRVQGEVLFLTSKHIDCCHQSKEECIRLSQTLQTPCYRMTEFCLFSLESISTKALHLPISAATCLLFLMLFFTPKTHSFIQLATSVSYRTQLLFDHGTRLLFKSQEAHPATNSNIAIRLYTNLIHRKQYFHSGRYASYSSNIQHRHRICCWMRHLRILFSFSHATALNLHVSTFYYYSKQW